jgi:hypothetical protein
MLQPDDLKKAATWAFLTAKAWGWTWSYEDGMIWVNTGSNTIGCSGTFDFVSFVSDESKVRKT